MGLAAGAAAGAGAAAAAGGISAGTALAIGAGVSGAASLAGSLISSGATSSAASKQAQSAAAAQAAQDRATAFNEANQQPFIDAGTDALTRQNGQINDFYKNIAPFESAALAEKPIVPGAMTQADLEATPGYKFTLDNGLRAVQNSAAARGLGVSGAALKGAATYATGLSDATYAERFAQQQQLFGDQQTRFGDANIDLGNALNVNNQAFNQNSSRVQVGENASTQSGTQGQAGATNLGNIDVGLGNGQAASTIAGGNALASGFNGVGNAVTSAATINALTKGGGIYGNGGGFVDNTTPITG